MAADAGRPEATERAASLAAELGIELEWIAGTGKGGRITVADVRATGSDRLGPDGERLWEDVKAYLEEFGLWRDVYGDLLDRYVRNLMRSRWARERAERNPTVKGSTGQPVANPLFAVARAAELDAHRYAEALLLTPEALKKELTETGGKDDGVGF